jgi:predicted acetyltransferase
MPEHVRPLGSDAEFDAYLRAARYAFHIKRDDAVLDRYRAVYRPEWCLGAFDGDDLVAGLTILPFEQHMMGRRIPYGGVATVATLPQHRRRGHVGALLRSALNCMYEQGQALSGLYTPHFSLYRRFGWEIAGRIISYSFAPKAVAVRFPHPGGVFEPVGVDAWRQLAAVRDAYVASRNGPLTRDEQWWLTGVFSEDQRQHDAVLWRNSDGETRGYAVYTQYRRPVPPSNDETVLRVVDWVALDGDAYAAILQFLLSHDLAARIVMNVAEDEPLPAAFIEPSAMETPSAHLGPMLRLVDVRRAFEHRPALPGADGLEVVLQIHDSAAPWNAGVWRIAAGGQRFVVDSSAAAPQLELDATSLGPIYNGFMQPAEAARVGAICVHDEAAVGRLARLCAVSSRPACLDEF